MRILAITGTHPRHDLFVHHLQKHYELYAHLRVVREEMIPEPPEWVGDELSILWQLHFQKREAAELRYFGHPKLGPVKRTYSCHPNGLNNEHVMRWVRDNLEPIDLCFVAGVPIIKDELMSVLPPWTINYHMGIIPEWRGSITTVWPYLLCRPDLIGVTYHVIAKEVDAGMLVHQAYPELHHGMGLHDVSSAAYLKGCEEIGRVLKFAEQNISDGVLPKLDDTLARKGKIFKKKDFHPMLLAVIYNTYSDRLVDWYLDGDLGPLERPEIVRL